MSSTFTPEAGWGRYQHLTSEDDSNQDRDLAQLWGRLATDLPVNAFGPAILDKRLVHIDDQGQATSIPLHKHEIVRDLGIHYRDALMLDPAVPIPFPPCILIRPAAIIVNLESVRMIICSNQCMVLSIPKDGDPSAAALPTLTSPFIKSLCECLAHDQHHYNNNNNQRNRSYTETTGSSFDKDMPYELRALEVSIAAVTKALDMETFALESDAYPLLEDMTQRLHLPVEKLRDVKTRLKRLTLRLERIKQTLQIILADDADMADLYLARKAEDEGEQPPPQPLSVQLQQRQQLQTVTEEAAASNNTTTSNKSGGITNKNGDNTRSEKVSVMSTTTTTPRHSGGTEHGHSADNNTRQLQQKLHTRRSSFVIRTVKSRKVSTSPAAAVVLPSSGTKPASSRGGVSKTASSKSGVASTTHHDNDAPHKSSKTDASTHTDINTAGTSNITGEGKKHMDATKQHDGVLLDTSEPEQHGGAQHHHEGISDEEEEEEEEVVFENPIGRLFPVDPREIDLAEDLLETGFIQVDYVLRRLILLTERIESDELLFKLAIDGRRNELQALDLVATVTTAAFGWVSMIGGVFGMNLYNTPLLENNKQFFVITILVCLAGLVAIPAITLNYVHRRRLTMITSFES